MHHSVHFNKPDYKFLSAALAIVIFGLIVLSFASSFVGFERRGSSYYYLTHQVLFGFLPGLALLIVFSKINYRFWQKRAIWFFLATIFLLVMVFVPAVGYKSGTVANSWIKISNYTFQPSEVVKLSLIIYLAAWLTQKKERTTTFFHGFLTYLVIMTFVLGLIALQPDIGTMTVVAFIGFCLYLLAGAKWRYLISLVSLGVAGLVALIKIAPYRLNRLLIFRDPTSDPQGKGYHITQALLAVGSGYWFGLGFGRSRQKYEYLPEVYGDSIFAIMAEELGFLGTLFFISVFFYFFYRGMKIARGAPDDFSKLVVAGIMIWFAGQTFINIGAMINLLPLTGLPLPLVSYGGSALLISMAAIGLVLNISKYTKVK